MPSATVAGSVVAAAVSVHNVDGGPSFVPMFTAVLKLKGLCQEGFLLSSYCLAASFSSSTEEPTALSASAKKSCFLLLLLVQLVLLPPDDNDCLPWSACNSWPSELAQALTTLNDPCVPKR